MGDCIKRLGKVQQHEIYLTMGVQDRSPIVDHGDQLGLIREALLKAVLEMRYKMIRTEMTCNVLVNSVLHIFANQRCQGYGTIAHGVRSVAFLEESCNFGVLPGSG